MKKTLLSLLTLVIVLTSCQKEDDLLTPVPPPPINNVDNTTNTNNNGVYVVESSPTFIGEGKKYNITLNEFSLECSELTPFNQDTSYSYTDVNTGEANFSFSDSTKLITTTYPQNSNYAVPHSVNFSNYLIEWTIDNYYYNDGYLTMDLQRVSCTGEILVEWQVVMLVTEYSDGSFDLSIDQNGYEAQQNISWSSHLKLHLVEKK